MSRSVHQKWCAAVALLALALWFFLLGAEAWTPLHAWMHGGTIPVDDHCPIAQLQQGEVDHFAAAVVLAAFIGFAIVIRFTFSVPFVASFPLPNVRGPPVGQLAMVTA
jgi:hypothetical protein